MSDHPVDQLGQWEFDQKAGMAASMLHGHGHAYVDLQPGDGTSYKIVIVQPLAAVNLHRSPTGWQLAEDRYFVATSFGPLWGFNPSIGHLSWDYVLDHFIADRSASSASWTARVIARFLNTLAERMRD